MLQRSIWRSTCHRRIDRSCRQPALLLRRATSGSGQVPYPTVEACPAPTCACSATPAGLDIKRDGPMSIPQYAAHVVIHTERSDWSSRIEDDQTGYKVAEGAAAFSQPNLARSLKGMLGPKGSNYDPDRPVVISNSDQLRSEASSPGHTLHLFPENVLFPYINDSPVDQVAFIQQWIQNKNPNPRRGSEEAISAAREAETGMSNSLHINCWYPSILICGHGARDSRCGLLGPLLRHEFDQYIRGHPDGWGNLKAVDIKSSVKEMEWASTEFKQKEGDCSSMPRTALVSHIGGHAWAGNVIIYIPPNFLLKDGSAHPLTGRGIWYGRVEPKHVEGILNETVKKGIIIEELLRGVR